MDFFTTELRDKPIIGMVSGFGSWLLYQINITSTSGFFSDANPIWGMVSKFGVLMGSLIAVLTFLIKLKDFYEKYFKKTKG